jgi:branched-chain amino acid transport system ATP-binding protein
MLLEVKELVCGYRKKTALRRVSMDVDEKEVVGLIGHNGAGKTTLLKSIFGILHPWNGRVLYSGSEITGRPPSSNVRDGISFMPQGQGLFPDLSVRDNLELGGFALAREKETLPLMERVFELFPILRDRQRQKAGTLSGGEQRMLSLGITLMQEPRLLLLDEPSLGLAPLIVQHVMETIGRINTQLQTAILIVEQNIEVAARLASRFFVIKVGRVVFSGSSEIAADKRRLWDLF